MKNYQLPHYTFSIYIIFDGVLPFGRLNQGPITL